MRKCVLSYLIISITLIHKSVASDYCKSYEEDFNSSRNAIQYWRHYEEARGEGKVKNLLQHVENLADIDVCSMRNQENLNYRKNALGYFFATGGKNGFRSKPATNEERNSLEKSLITLAFLHAGEWLTPIETDFNFVSLRREAGFTQEEGRVVTHLLIAQRLFSASRALIISLNTDGEKNSNNYLKHHIQKTFKKGYLENTIKALAEIPSFKLSPELFDECKGNFAKAFTLDLEQKIKDRVILNSGGIGHYYSEISRPIFINNPDFFTDGNGSIPALSAHEQTAKIKEQTVQIYVEGICAELKETIISRRPRYLQITTPHGSRIKLNLTDFSQTLQAITGKEELLQKATSEEDFLEDMRKSFKGFKRKYIY